MNKILETICNPYIATIYCGLRNSVIIEYKTFSEVYQICQDYCNEIGLCVCVKECKYIYTNGYEPGVEITIINHPRFPKRDKFIKKQSLELAKKLMIDLNQCSVTICFSD